MVSEECQELNNTNKKIQKEINEKYLTTRLSIFNTVIRCEENYKRLLKVLDKLIRIYNESFVKIIATTDTQGVSLNEETEENFFFSTRFEFDGSGEVIEEEEIETNNKEEFQEEEEENKPLTKPCERCGKIEIPNYLHNKYCVLCAPIVKKEQTNASLRRSRKKREMLLKKIKQKREKQNKPQKSAENQNEPKNE